jgi:hypothetical protein
VPLDELAAAEAAAPLSRASLDTLADSVLSRRGCHVLSHAHLALLRHSPPHRRAPVGEEALTPHLSGAAHARIKVRALAQAVCLIACVA